MKIGSKASLAVPALAFLLAACGGGGGGDTTVVTPASINGVVADGYLYKAKVCSDQNDNKMCDPLEPSILTDENGTYTLTGKDVDLHPILVEVGTDAFDQDNPNTPIAKPFTLMAPAPADKTASQVVTPITTLVKHTMDQNPTLTREQAAQSTKAQLGVSDTADLFADYIAVSGADSVILHTTARVVTKAMAEAQEAIKAAAAAAPDANNLDPATLSKTIAKLVVQNTLDQLQTIVAAVATAKDAANFDPKTFDVTSVPTTAPVTTNIVNDIQAAAKPVTIADAKTVLESAGIYWAHADAWGVERGYVTVPANSTTLSFADEWFNSSTGQWEAVPVQRDRFLVNGNWTEPLVDGEGDQITYNADNSFTITNATKGSQEKITLVKKDLAGLSMASVLGAQAKYLLNKKATFPAGSVGYSLTFERLSDSYEISQWINPNDPTGFDRNYVATRNMGNETIIRSLAEVETSFAYQNQGNNYLWIESIPVQFAPNGVLRVFQEGLNGQKTEIATGTFAKVTVQTKELMMLNIPQTLLSGIDKNFLVEMQDSVRGNIVQFGDFTPKNVTEFDTDFSGNKVAQDAILGNLALSGVIPAYSNVQYRNSENPANSGTRSYIQYELTNQYRQLSTMVSSVDFINQAGTVISNDLTPSTDVTYIYNCLSGTCIDEGNYQEEYYSFSNLPQLATGDYSFVAKLTNGTSITSKINYPGDTVVPYVSRDTMSASWQPDGSLRLNWTNPVAVAGWDKVSQVRVFMSQGTTSQGLMIKLNSSAESVTVPAEILAQRNIAAGSTWRIQTRAYDAYGSNYARGESNALTILP